MDWAIKISLKRPSDKDGRFYFIIQVMNSILLSST